MDISKVSTFTDCFVIATADNPRQMNALIESLDTDLRDEGIRPSRKEGTPDSGWVLIDFGDAIVHLFSRDRARVLQARRAVVAGRVGRAHPVAAQSSSCLQSSG